MIYTLTLNPAIDYIMNMNEVSIGNVNKSMSENIYYGGKGINVSVVLSNMGVESVAMGFVAGFTGIQLKTAIEKLGIASDMVIPENGLTRINVKINTDVTTELNCKGPEIRENDIKRLYGRLDRLIDGDILVISGSVPRGVSSTIYSEIIKYLGDKKIKIIVDSTGNLLLNTLEYKPFMVKPNIVELEEMVKAKIEGIEDVIYYGRVIKNRGAQNVLISMGEKGAILVCEDGRVYGGRIVGGKVKGTVGAGDSMVAGFIKGYMESKDYKYALKMGIACGSATAYSEGLAEREKISVMLDEVEDIL